MAANVKIKLDDVDRRILSDLQGYGRMTNVDLAKQAGISAPPCLRRVRALEDNGIIRGYHADIDADALGYSVTVFAFVGLTSQAESDLQEFEEMVSAWQSDGLQAHACSAIAQHPKYSVIGCSCMFLL